MISVDDKLASSMRHLRNCLMMPPNAAGTVIVRRDCLDMLVAAQERLAGLERTAKCGKCVVTEMEQKADQIRQTVNQFALLAATLTEPERTAKAVAEAVERVVTRFEAAVGDGYDIPARKVDQCEHAKFGWEDCIACYDEALHKAIAAIRDEGAGG